MSMPPVGQKRTSLNGPWTFTGTGNWAGWGSGLEGPAVVRLPDGRWSAPFVMASFNTRIVRRSNALQGWAYGRGMSYGEVMGVGRGPLGAVTAAGLTAGLAGTLAAMSFPPTRRTGTSSSGMSFVASSECAIGL